MMHASNSTGVLIVAIGHFFRKMFKPSADQLGRRKATINISDQVSGGFPRSLRSRVDLSSAPRAQGYLGNARERSPDAAPDQDQTSGSDGNSGSET